EKKRLAADEFHAELAPQGYLFFVRDISLMMQQFDLSKNAIVGEAIPIAEKIYSESGAGVASFSISQNGILTYAETSGYGTQQFSWADRQGKSLGILGDVGISGDPSFSPDGKKVVFYSIHASAAARPDIWTAELEHGTATRFTFDPSNEFEPLWSPDGSQIVFASNRKGSYDLYIKNASGNMEEKPLLESKEWKFPLDWSRDER